MVVSMGDQEALVLQAPQKAPPLRPPVASADQEALGQGANKIAHQMRRHRRVPARVPQVMSQAPRLVALWLLLQLDPQAS